MITADEIRNKMLQDMEVEVSIMIKTTIEYLEDAILKAVAKKQQKVYLPIRKKVPVLLPLKDSRIYQVVRKYFRALGFCFSKDTYLFDRWSYLEISWEIDDALFTKTFEACTTESRLKYLLITGQAPKVVVGKEDEAV